MTYSVKEIFYTLQGEGAQSGRAAVFCRFAGCNLWSGREEDRASAVCKFCDTDFVGTDGPGGGQFASAAELARAIAAHWPADPCGCGRPYVVCTGGEPILQLDPALIAALHGQGFETVDLERHLLGQLDVALKEGRFARASLTESVAGGSLTALQRVPGLPVKALGGDNAFRNLGTMFEVKDGRMNMRKPVDFTLDGNRVQLDGAIGIAGKLFLTGTYFLRGRALEQMTGGKCGAMPDMPVPVQIGGTVDAPRFTVDAKAAMRPLAERCLKAGLVSAAQAVEHYEMARYGTLRTWASQLGLKQAVSLLDETLAQEKNADKLLSRIAIGGPNRKAA